MMMIMMMYVKCKKNYYKTASYSTDTNMWNPCENVAFELTPETESMVV